MTNQDHRRLELASHAVLVWTITSYPLTYVVIAQIGKLATWVGAGHVAVPSATWALALAPAALDLLAGLCLLALGSRPGLDHLEGTARFALVSGLLLTAAAWLMVKGLHIS